MICKYYRGERRNPFEGPDGGRSGDIRALYWWLEQFVGRIPNPTEGIKGYPCQAWPDFIQRAKANLSERGLAFEIDYQNSKHNCGEYNEDWYSYFAGPRLRWQESPCDVPGTAIDLSDYTFSDCLDCYGYSFGKLIGFGPIVTVIYRGICKRDYSDWNVPVFEVQNLKGDKLYVISPGYEFRHGNFEVSTKYVDSDGSELSMYVYDKRLHVALARLVLDDNVPAVCVGEQLHLPTNAEADEEIKWYRLRTVTDKSL